MNDTIQGLWWGKLGKLQRLSIKSYLDAGHDYHLYTYPQWDQGGIDVPAGTRVCDAGDIVHPDYVRRFKFTAHFADFFRYVLLLNKGGWWVDLDTVCLKPFENMADFVVTEEKKQGGTLGCNNAYLRAPIGSPEISYLLSSVFRYDGISNPWRATACDIAETMCKERRITPYPWSMFNPINWWNWKTIFDRSLGEGLLLSDLQPYAVHLWHGAVCCGGGDWEVKHPEGCLYEQLLKRHGVC